MDDQLPHWESTPPTQSPHRDSWHNEPLPRLEWPTQQQEYAGLVSTDYEQPKSVLPPTAVVAQEVKRQVVVIDDSQEQQPVEQESPIRPRRRRRRRPSPEPTGESKQPSPMKKPRLDHEVKETKHAPPAVKDDIPRIKLLHPQQRVVIVADEMTRFYHLPAAPCPMYDIYRAWKAPILDLFRKFGDSVLLTYVSCCDKACDDCGRSYDDSSPRCFRCMPLQHPCRYWRKKTATSEARQKAEEQAATVYPADAKLNEHGITFSPSVAEPARHDSNVSIKSIMDQRALRPQLFAALHSLLKGDPEMRQCRIILDYRPHDPPVQVVNGESRDMHPRFCNRLAEADLASWAWAMMYSQAGHVIWHRSGDRDGQMLAMQHASRVPLPSQWIVQTLLPNNRTDVMVLNETTATLKCVRRTPQAIVWGTVMCGTDWVQKGWLFPQVPDQIVVEAAVHVMDILGLRDLGLVHESQLPAIPDKLWRDEGEGDDYSTQETEGKEAKHVSIERQALSDRCLQPFHVLVDTVYSMLQVRGKVAPATITRATRAKRKSAKRDAAYLKHVVPQMFYWVTLHGRLDIRDDKSLWTGSLD